MRILFALSLVALVGAAGELGGCWIC